MSTTPTKTTIQNHPSDEINQDLPPASELAVIKEGSNYGAETRVAEKTITKEFYEQRIRDQAYAYWLASGNPDADENWRQAKEFVDGDLCHTGITVEGE